MRGTGRSYRFAPATTGSIASYLRARCVASVWAASPTQCRWLFAPIVLLTFSGSPLARSRSYGVRVRRGHPAREGCSPGRTCLGLQSGLGRWGHAHKQTSAHRWVTAVFSISHRHNAPRVHSSSAAVLHAPLQALRRFAPLFPLFSNARTGAGAQPPHAPSRRATKSSQRWGRTATVSAA